MPYAATKNTSKTSQRIMCYPLRLVGAGAAGELTLMRVML